MANSRQIQILDKIQEKRTFAKSHHRNVATELSGGQPRYKSAINTMISVGAISVVVSMIILWKELFVWTYYIASCGWETIDNLTAIIIFLEFATFITTIVLGYKLSRVDATPTFAIVSLIIILIANLCLAAGIFPLITVILAIIGLARWGTYKDWFYNICTKKVAKQGKKRTKSK